MTCEEARQIALEADSEALRRALSGKGALGHHVAFCAGCAGQLRGVLELNESLHSQLSELHPAQPLEFAIKHAVGESARRRESGRRRLLGRSLVPLAAAATVAGVLAVRSSGPATDPESSTSFAAAAVHAASGAESVDVTAPEGTNVAVFKTSNPNIVVFWFYEGGEGR